MKIVHISDLHITTENLVPFAKIREALFADIRNQVGEEGRIDVVVFSGDLTYRGDEEGFSLLKEKFLAPLIDSFSLAREQIVLCPGNHDISKAWVEDPLNNANQRASDVDKDHLDKILVRLEQEAEFQKHFLGRLSAYKDFLEDFYEKPISNRDLLAGVHHFSIEDTTACFAVLNTAWWARGTGGTTEKGKLAIGKRSLEWALESLKKSDLCFAVCHHPPDWLTEFDQEHSEQFLSTHMDFLLTGHTHRADPVVVQRPGRRLIHSKAGALYQNEDYPIGYNLILSDAGSPRWRVYSRTYIAARNVFEADQRVAADGCHVIPDATGAGPDKGRGLKAQDWRRLRRYVENVLLRHMKSFQSSSDDSLSLEDHLIDVSLARSPQFGPEEVGGSKPEEVSEAEIFDSDDNLIIFGDRLSGKTTLAYKLCLRSLSLERSPRIPVYSSGKNIKEIKGYAEHRLLRDFYEKGKMEEIDLPFKRIFSEEKLLIVIDDIDPDDEDLISAIEKLSKSHKKHRYILFLEAMTPTSDASKTLGEAFPEWDALFIHPLSRTGIRTATAKYSKFTGISEDKAFDTVMQSMVSSGLPRTPYYVALLSWAMTTRKAVDRINEAVLLEALVNAILRRSELKDLLTNRLDTRFWEIILQEISFKIKSSPEQKCLYQDLEVYVSQYFMERGITYQSSYVLFQLILLGILNREGDYIYFSQRCFMEYFISTSFRDQTQRLYELSDVDLSEYHKEIELYAGLSRRDGRILTRLNDILEQEAVSFQKGIDLSRAFENLPGFMRLPDFSKRAEDLPSKRLTAAQLDALTDRAERNMYILQKREGGVEVSLDRKSELARIFSDFFKTLVLTSRVLRNLDFLEIEGRVSCLKGVLQHWTLLAQFMAQQVKEVILTISLDNDEAIDEELAEKDVEDVSVLVVSLVVSHVFAQAFGSDRTESALVSVSNDNEVSLLKRYFVAVTLAHLRAKGWEKTMESLIEDAHQARMKGFLAIIFETLEMLYIPLALKADEARRVEALVHLVAGRLSDGGRKAGRIGTQAVQDLKKKKILSEGQYRLPRKGKKQ